MRSGSTITSRTARARKGRRPAAARGPRGRPRPAVELRGIEKRFGDNRANRSVDLVVEAGTIHGIVGENGAGKTILMNILYGLYRADAGEIRVNGRPFVKDR